MIPVIDAADTAAALPFDALIAALRTAFAGDTIVPERHHHHIHRPGGDDGILLLMPAWTDRLLGTKIATVHAGNGRRGLPTVHSNYLLADAATGAPLALIDGDQITRRRTIAASALAASFLAHERAETLLIVGAGQIGALAAQAFSAVRPIRHVLVWNRDAAKGAALADELAESGFDARATIALDRAAATADIITCATPSTTPIICGEWLKPGAHLDLIGSFTPAMREADDACVARAEIYVDVREALVEAGDLIDPLAADVIGVDAIRGTLADLCTGRVAGRTTPDAVTLYKSVGTALADLAAAALVHARHAGDRNA